MVGVVLQKFRPLSQVTLFLCHTFVLTLRALIKIYDTNYLGGKVCDFVFVQDDGNSS